MHYQRIENALAICSDHIRMLDQDNIKNKELESFIVAGLVVLIVSEYEEYLESLFIERAEKCGDTHVSNYIRNNLNQKFRSPDLSKINQQLLHFDAACKDAFLKEIENSPEHAAWDSLLKARHSVVHKKGNLNLTFRELTQSYHLTKQVISGVESALGLRARQATTNIQA